jgi:hypothetical protein
MIIITVSANNKSFTERIPDRHTRIKVDPSFYRPVQFVLDSRETLDRYKDHFIYGYLEAAYQNNELPNSLIKAEALAIVVIHEPEAK